jgi:hypothetical protein
MNPRILVVAHKPFDNSILNDAYFPVEVGAGLKNPQMNYQKDNQGENISDKNPTYCELTALYWAYKNMDESFDVSGLVHYRRYFVKRPYSNKKIADQILNSNDIGKILAKYDIILPKRSYRMPCNPKLYKKYRKDRELTLQQKQLLVSQKIIADEYQDYSDSFVKYTYGYTISWGNMFISSRKIFDAYCAWVFPLLAKIEKELTKQNLMEPRVMGFISEILLCVWADKNCQRIKYITVVNSENYLTNRLKKCLYVLKIYPIISFVKHLYIRIKYKY